MADLELNASNLMSVLKCSCSDLPKNKLPWEAHHSFIIEEKIEERFEFQCPRCGAGLLIYIVKDK